MDGAANLNQAKPGSKKPSAHDLIFENLITLDELVADLRGKHTKLTFYKWLRQGMPHSKRGGRIYVDPEEFALWYKRTKQ